MRFSSVQLLSHVGLCDPMDCSTPGFPSSPALRAYSNSCPSSQCWHPTISSCRPLLLLPSIFPSIRIFSNESVLCIRWPKYWSFRFNFSPSNEYSGFISFRMDWLYDGLVGSPCSPRDSQESSLTPQFKSINYSALSFLYSPHMTTGNTIALIRHTFVDKAMSLLFNMVSRLVITFLPRSKHLLISWL